jgi:hypothetical protein
VNHPQVCSPLLIGPVQGFWQYATWQSKNSRGLAHQTGIIQGEEQGM